MNFFADFQGQASSSIPCVEPTETRRPIQSTFKGDQSAILKSTRFPGVIYVGQFLNCNPRIEPKVPWNNITLNFCKAVVNSCLFYVLHLYYLQEVPGQLCLS